MPLKAAPMLSVSCSRGTSLPDRGPSRSKSFINDCFMVFITTSLTFLTDFKALLYRISDWDVGSCRRYETSRKERSLCPLLSLKKEKNLGDMGKSLFCCLNGLGLFGLFWLLWLFGLFWLLWLFLLLWLFGLLREALNNQNPKQSEP